MRSKFEHMFIKLGEVFYNFWSYLIKWDKPRKFQSEMKSVVGLN